MGEVETHTTSQHGNINRRGVPKKGVYELKGDTRKEKREGRSKEERKTVTWDQSINNKGMTAHCRVYNVLNMYIRS